MMKEETEDGHCGRLRTVTVAVTANSFAAVAPVTVLQLLVNHAPISTNAML